MNIHASGRQDPSGLINPPSARARHNIGFWLIAASFLIAMAFSTVPTPLYPLYQQRDGFSTPMVTLVFAVYAVGVVASLILVGHVSDWVGRKRILIPALALEVVAAALFLVWSSLPGLLVARLITGLGVGMITATATAFLHELHAVGRPDSGRGRFEIVSTAANIGGLGVGTLVAGLLAEYVRGPLRTPYLIFVLLLLLAIAAVAASPETVLRPSQSPAWSPQVISVNLGDRAGYLAAAVAAFAAFSIFGLFTSLAPGFVAGTLHHASRALAGLIVFAVFGAAAVAQMATNRLGTPARRAIGLATKATGLIVLAVGMQNTNLIVFLIGGVIAGGGAGILFKSAIGAVAAMAQPAQRGGALAGLFLVAYLGLIVPAIGLGIATKLLTAPVAMWWFTVAILAVMGACGALAAAARRSPS
ncbi:MFS transporter [Nocardia salmonicida]|uniref:MFS transporter n=1 Tax=Nocardia salmonicida TaxID=53431 RepID=UPI002E2B671B|nr:MFS transporter [Nocardia salmonicida]